MLKDNISCLCALIQFVRNILGICKFITYQDARRVELIWNKHFTNITHQPLTQHFNFSSASCIILFYIYV